MWTCRFFTKNDGHAHKHHPGVKNCRGTNPILSFDKRIDRQYIKRSVEKNIDPDGHLPPLRTGYEQWVKGTSIRVDQLDHGSRRPKWLLKMGWVRNDQLFDVHNIRNEKQIDHEEANKDPIHPAL
jgi:hypothetical protein